MVERNTQSSSEFSRANGSNGLIASQLALR